MEMWQMEELRGRATLNCWDHSELVLFCSYLFAVVFPVCLSCSLVDREVRFWGCGLPFEALTFLASP